MKKNLKAVKLVIMDVDGVLTDGRIILGEEEELKFFDVRDGMGITLAKKSGLKIGIITGRRSIAVKRRCKELDIDYLIQGSKNKLKSLDNIIEKEKIQYKNVCYIGDDIIDVPIFKKVGFSATVNDAPDYIKPMVSYISSKPGGRGAVRDIIEYILREQGVLDSVIKDMICEFEE
ncbi:MAG: HAD-IIIA family hydrolase [Candidatus Thermoplasmatota archaeon]